MRIRILSDLHLEFMPRLHASEFIRRVPNDCDVLVLAGDVSNAEGIGWALRRFADRFENVVYVAGNHEFYGSSPIGVMDALDDVPDNVHVLENGVVRIGSLGLDGQRFVGCSLWFPRVPDAPTWALNDFAQIRGFVPWVYEHNAASVAFLEREVRPGDVVVTHHLPSPKCVHPKYAHSPLNAFFVCDVEHVIRKQNPALWVHGHTHESVDTTVGETRIVCNPHGYFGHEVNAGFDPRCTVEVAP